MPFMLIVQLYGFAREAEKQAFFCFHLRSFEQRKKWSVWQWSFSHLVFVCWVCGVWVWHKWDSCHIPGDVSRCHHIPLSLSLYPPNYRLSLSRTHFNHTASRHKLPVSVCFAPFSTFLAHAWLSWTGAASLWPWHKIATHHLPSLRGLRSLKYRVRWWLEFLINNKSCNL